MKVVGIASQFCMGKDVVADYLVESLRKKDPNWQRGSFAEAVKNIYQDSFGVTREFIEKWKRINEPPPGMLQTAREAMQFIGDGFRKIKPDIWIEIALRDESKQLVLSDARYVNEAKEIVAKNGIMVVLYRPGFLNNDPNDSESQIKPILEFCSNYLEEGPIPDFVYLKSKYKDKCPDEMQFYNYFILNNGSLEQLYSKIDAFLTPFIDNKYVA